MLPFGRHTSIACKTRHVTSWPMGTPGSFKRVGTSKMLHSTLEDDAYGFEPSYTTFWDCQPMSAVQPKQYVPAGRCWQFLDAFDVYFSDSGSNLEQFTRHVSPLDQAWGCACAQYDTFWAFSERRYMFQIAED